MIELNDLTVCLGNQTILEHCNFHLNDGEHVAIMGPSGSGKTTLLNVIAGLVPPSRGTVQVQAAKISYMFQEPRLLPWLNAEDNVNLVLSDRAATKPTARHWLKLVGLEHDGNKYPDALSGGMQQRVALARCLAYPGDLILMDEPLSALDRDTADALLHTIREHTAGRSMVFVTHRPEQAKAVADHVYQLNNKALEQIF